MTNAKRLKRMSEAEFAHTMKCVLLFPTYRYTLREVEAEKERRELATFKEAKQ